MGGLCFKHKDEDLDSSYITCNDSGEEIPPLADFKKVKPPRQLKEKLRIKKKGVPALSKYRGKKRNRSSISQNPISGNVSSTKENSERMESLKTKTLEIFATISSPTSTSEALAENTNNNLYEKHKLPQKEYLQRRRQFRHCPRVRRVKPQTQYIKKPPPPDFFTLLDAEIAEQVMNSLKLIQSLAPVCEFIRTHIQSLARSVFNAENISAVLYGSMATGFAYENSDMDFALRGLHVTSQDSLNEQIELLSKKLSSDPLITECQAIPSARVPVIKLKITTQKLSLRKDSLKADITFDVSFDGQPSAAYLGIRGMEYVLVKSREFPVLKPVCIILKKLLESYGLNKPYVGGMSSFVLLLMICALLHMSPSYKSPSQCLLNFLQYYGSIFDYRKASIVGDCIVIMDGQFPVAENIGLAVSSPLQPGINIAYNVTRFEEIKACFCNTYGKIMKEKEEGTSSNILDKVLSSNNVL